LGTALKQLENLKENTYLGKYIISMQVGVYVIPAKAGIQKTNYIEQKHGKEAVLDLYSLF
jgi:hypothetical protein